MVLEKINEVSWSHIYVYMLQIEEQCKPPSCLHMFLLEMGTKEHQEEVRHVCSAVN